MQAEMSRGHLCLSLSAEVVTDHQPQRTAYLFATSGRLGDISKTNHVKIVMRPPRNGPITVRTFQLQFKQREFLPKK